MTKIGFFYTFILIVLLSSCAPSVEKQIKNWEAKQNQCEFIKLINLSDPKPFYFSDSLKILTLKYDSLYELKLNNLSYQIDSAKLEYEQALFEYRTINNSILKKAYKLGLNSLKIKYELLLRADSIYKYHPEQTAFQTIQKQINNYQKSPDKLIGYIYSVEFYGKEGQLQRKAYQKTYLLDSLESKIIAEN